MKRLKVKASEFLAGAGNESARRLRVLCVLCGKPSPAKRLARALLLVVLSGGINLWLVASSIYNMGRQDAEQKFPDMQHIESLKLRNDSAFQWRMESGELRMENQ